MPDLSSIDDSSYKALTEEILRMNRGKAKEGEKPHKLVLLLAVIDLFDQGVIRENKIYYDQRLWSAFKNIFSLISKEDDWCQPGPPFFHLRSSGFWKHKIIEGREKEYAKLRTSGGGSKRIIDNIEYAYFSDYAFKVIINPDLRKILRGFLTKLLNPANKPFKENIPQRIAERKKPYRLANRPIQSEDNMPHRIPISFHEGFSLNREGISKIVNVISEYPLGMPEEDSLIDFFKPKTNLGPNQVKAYAKYAIGCGLVDLKYSLTEFGKASLIYDALYTSLSTQWLLHYFLSSPHGPGPIYWSQIVRSFFVLDRTFTSKELEEKTKSFDRATGKHVVDNSIRSAITILLGSYLKNDGLNNLCMLEQTQKDWYTVKDPQPASFWTMAVALIDYWQNEFSGRRQVTLDELIEDNDFTRIFMVGTRRMNRLLEIMQSEGYIDLYFTSPPYTAVLLRTDTRELLEKMYTENETL